MYFVIQICDMLLQKFYYSPRNVVKHFAFKRNLPTMINKIFMVKYEIYCRRKLNH